MKGLLCLEWDPYPIPRARQRQDNDKTKVEPVHYLVRQQRCERQCDSMVHAYVLICRKQLIYFYLDSEDISKLIS